MLPSSLIIRFLYIGLFRISFFALERFTLSDKIFGTFSIISIKLKFELSTRGISTIDTTDSIPPNSNIVPLRSFIASRLLELKISDLFGVNVKITKSFVE